MWILECVSYGSFSTLWNGSPTCLVEASMGLRQGVFISPFFITIVVEAFGSFLLKAKIEHNSGLEVSRNEKRSLIFFPIMI